MICTHGLSTDTPCLKCALANGVPLNSSEAAIALDAGPGIKVSVSAPNTDATQGGHWYDCGGLCGGDRHVLGPFVSDEVAIERGREHNEAGQRGLSSEADFVFWDAASVRHGKELERSRIRALFLKHYSNDWNAVQFLKELDE